MLRVERRWTISNLLSVSRVILLVPIVFLMFKPGSQFRLTVVILMVIATLTDFFDGLLARSLNQVTDFGKILDPVADKICVVVASFALVIAGDVPIWFALLVLLRDFAILVGGSMIITKRRIVVQSTWAGKWTVTFIAAYLVLATLRADSIAAVTHLFLYLSTVFLFISFAVYFRIFKKDMVEST